MVFLMEDLNRAHYAKARDISNRNLWNSWDSVQDLKECRFHCCHLSNISFHNPLVDTTHVLCPLTHLHTNQSYQNIWQDFDRFMQRALHLLINA